MSGAPVVGGLAKRITTAAVLVPVVVAAVWYLPGTGFAAVIGAFAVAAAWEWAALAGFVSQPARVAYALLVGVSLGAAARLLAAPGGALMLLGAGAVWWVVALAWVVRYQQGCEPEALASRASAALCGWLVVVPAWAALVELHGEPHGGRAWVLVLLVVIWVADSVAYFAGRLLGRRRLASRVSPGKSIEGALAGLVVVGLGALGAGGMLGLGVAVGPFALLCVAAALVSLLGDLAESLFKRRAGVKDSGLMMPGHGGVLDRIDSLVAAAPFFALGVRALGGEG